jgi:DnaJ domain
MRIAFFCILLASLSQFYFGLDDSLIERDLYKDLGLKIDASLQDIKKAFRKLAQIHHPDKSQPSNREANEAIFREVAAAYEVLSDSAQRQEYDSIRSLQQRRGNARPQYGSSEQTRGRQGRNQPRQYDQYSSDSDESSNNYEYRNIFTFSGYRPIIAGPILPAMQVILPYTPIMVSQDRTHFALLDIHCSLGVYRGDVDVLIRNLLVADRPPDLTMMPLELKFRTEGDSTLNGQCFAGLDNVGVLRVFRGHPDYSEHSIPLWSSEPLDENLSDYNSYFRRFYVELSSSGELAVRMLFTGSSESHCVWSTTSCNEYVALLKDMRGQVTRTLIEVFDEAKELSTWIRSKVLLVLKFLLDKQQLNAFFKSGKKSILKQSTKFFNSRIYQRSFGRMDSWIPKSVDPESHGSRGASSSKSSGSNSGSSSGGSQSDSNFDSGAARRKRRLNANK